MKANLNILIGGLVIGLAACSTEGVKDDAATAKPVDNISPSANGPLAMPGQEPRMTITKNGKTLNLVRIMDGAVCKNDLEGAKGSFLLYAYPADIARIKRDKGAKIFSEFEGKIQSFSEHVLQEAIDKTNLSKDPFALGDDEAQQKLAQQLDENFRNTVAKAINAFEKETTLTIDVAAFPSSFVFYQKGCEATLPESDLTDMSGAEAGSY
ncbi:MAG: hypothetical protein Q7U57_00690 [Methylovulum sp.]|nr:hypothetical protein [Methylovulum sp.]